MSGVKRYFEKRWNAWKKKSWFSRISDALFVLLLVGMIVPATRKEIAAFVNKLFAPKPALLRAEKQMTVPEDAWNWSVQDESGQWVPLSTYKGKPIFLNFWATWCPPCIAEMPDIQNLYNDYGQSVAFLLITDESPLVVQSFMQRKSFSMPVYYHRYAVPPVFSTNSIPTTWLISPEGLIVMQKTGAAKWNSNRMREILDTMLTGKPF
ncbi:MAG TPA: redoxin domain-containing protein [Bacteroidales bacterium]|nr:redoxin domain-containing protein [Bacteroidales bacterium]